MQYPGIWQSFTQLQLTEGACQRDFPEWHKGRQRYHVWALATESPELLSRIDEFRQRLSPWLVQPYEREPHITLAATGFVTDNPRYNDDVHTTLIEAKMQHLQALPLAPFPLLIGGFNSFASAPFLEVTDPSGSLMQLRQALVGEGSDFRETPYVPHVTIGVYNGKNMVEDILYKLDGIPLQPISIMVNAVSLYSYEATDIGSALSEEWRMGLA